MLLLLLHACSMARIRCCNQAMILLLLGCCVLVARSQPQSTFPALIPPVGAPPGVDLPPSTDPESFSQSQIDELVQRRAALLTAQVAEKFSFCITDAEKDRDLAFKYPSAQFLADCASGGSLVNRLCGEGEIRLYFASIAKPDAPLPNLNCNTTNWSIGCEPGWASSLPSSIPAAQSMKDIKDLPLRIDNPQPCCEGFFCPRALTCMIPCPLGAYCPLSTLDKKSGTCLPYGYQMTPNISSSCGGADKWADIGTSPKVFCNPGEFCPSPAESRNCSEGNFCRGGSTSEQRCFKFTPCNVGSSQQNLSKYGIFFTVVLALMLLVIYCCSDFLMSCRDKRKAKRREKAALHAREHASAVKRWKKIEVAKTAKAVTSQLNKTFSRKRVKNSEDGQELSPIDTLKSDDPSFLEASDRVVSLRPPPVAFVDQNSNAIKKNIFGGQSETQILKYAFGEIEKEKDTVMNLNRELPLPKPRRAIELVFEDLTMILKKSGKKILSNVTGKLLPGHITAIMGPSGAGKTTFLNAVAGKTGSECRTTGRLFINGREGSIRSYRKIIGFVPQDDIVHGSLTVEENLWFSAKYRLPVGLPKRERVLIVERIIAALGLEFIRSSLVGTVEHRGISGGQRKRVNVGLEMVMEPSLLILDEPTSGLDSTSSRLVLQALRREAISGVNVVLVLHQPSYSLFRMFDNVMFLAKGGRTVYLGPVAEVESYFSSLGVDVPDRMNPPDLFMDLLEGVYKPEGNPQFDASLLPLIWMQHEGHKIPEEFKEAASALGNDESQVLKREKTLREEAWEDLKEPVEIWYDGIKHALFNIPDISGRRQPGFLRQFKLIFKRVAKQRFRESRLVAQDYIILFIAGMCVGALADVNDNSLGANGYTYSVIALSLLVMIAALRTFSNDKLQFWRESASGINRVAFFLAKDTVDHFNTVVKPIFFLSMFYFFNNPRSSFLSNYIITLAFMYCVTGVGYIFAILMQASTAQLCCVFFPVVSTLIATKRGAGGILQTLADMSFARWALEAYVVSNAKKYYGVWLITRCGILKKTGYDINNVNLCIFVLIAYGLGARLLAVCSLFFSNRRKQR